MGAIQSAKPHSHKRDVAGSRSFSARTRLPAEVPMSARIDRGGGNQAAMRGRGDAVAVAGVVAEARRRLNGADIVPPRRGRGPGMEVTEIPVVKPRRVSASR